MNQQDDDKATAALLLSTDEAVAEKLRRVLLKNPDIIADAMKRVEETLLLRQREAEYARALGQSMMNTKQDVLRNVYTAGTSAGNQFASIFGGKK